MATPSLSGPPVPPGTNNPSGTSSFMFPVDLIAPGKREYFISFQINRYNRPTPLTVPTLVPEQTIILPMPDMINDTPSVNWTQQKIGADAKNMIVKGALGNAFKGFPQAQAIANLGADALSAKYSLATNPFLTMLFDSPNFKRFTFSWLLSPRQQEDSAVLQNIILLFRKNMLPSSISGQSVILEYPRIFNAAFNPNDFLFDFKPMVIESMSVNYTPVSGPAFFVDKSPAQVKLTINFVEIDYWLREQVQK